VSDVDSCRVSMVATNLGSRRIGRVTYQELAEAKGAGVIDVRLIMGGSFDETSL